MRALVTLVPLLLLLTGCIDGVNQVAGTGAIYTTRCSADMEARGVEYFARCTPQTCGEGYASNAVNHVVVALDPGQRIIGFSERVCVQDLAQASGLFGPAVTGAAPQPPAPAPSEAPTL